MKQSKIAKLFYSGSSNFTGEMILRAVINPCLATSFDKGKSILLFDREIHSNADVAEFECALTKGNEQIKELPGKVVHVYDKALNLDEGDIVQIQANDGNAKLTVVYRIKSDDNCLIPTNKCNNGCMMCPQPVSFPDADDFDLNKIARIIGLIDKSTKFLGISGGEPTLLKENFVEILSICNNQLPATRIAALTNGRMLSYKSFVNHISSVGNKNITFCVALHSYQSEKHDRITQVTNSFDQTTRGIRNLLDNSKNVELRIVIQKDNYRDLPQIANYIKDNYSNISRVAFLAMEASGSAATNIDKVWIDWAEIHPYLEDAAMTLLSSRIETSLYNFPLCKISEPFRCLCADSISDYKVRYLKACDTCSAKKRCGGIFSASVRLLEKEGVSPIDGHAIIGPI